MKPTKLSQEGYSSKMINDMALKILGLNGNGGTLNDNNQRVCQCVLFEICFNNHV